MAVDLDICIPYRARPDLEPCLNLVLQAWNAETEISCCSVQVADGTDSVWRNGQARNEAARKGSAPYILFTDADMLIEPGGLSTILALCQPGHQYSFGGWYNPRPEGNRFEHDIDLPASYSASWWHDVINRSGLYWSTPTHYGPNLISRADWERVGGYDERYASWGAEDDAWLIVCRRAGVVQHIEPSPRFIHLPHYRICDEAAYQNNRALLDELLRGGA
jgi:hypothetical protein